MTVVVVGSVYPSLGDSQMKEFGWRERFFFKFSIKSVNVCFVTSEGNQKPNANYQFFCLFFLKRFKIKREEANWLDFFLNCNSNNELLVFAHLLMM